MLNSIGEWYRLLEPMLDDDRLRLRRSAAGKLVAALTSGDVGYALDITALALEAVLGRSDAENPALKAVMAAILEFQPSADPEGTADSLDPRICAAVSLSEFLQGYEAGKKKAVHLDAAAAVVAALRHRTLNGTHWAVRIGVALLHSAETVLDAADERRRDRVDTPITRFEKSVQTVDDVQTLVPAIQRVISSLHVEMLKDREEIQALWWVFGGYSYRAKKPYAAMTAGDAGVFAGAELSQIVKGVPARGMAVLAARAASACQQEAQEFSFRELVGSVSGAAWQVITPSGSGAEVVRRYPMLFPITRLALSKNPLNDLEELCSATCWQVNAPFSVEALAQQIFTEKNLLLSQQEG